MSVCATPIRGEVARFTLEDACGVPIRGDGSAQITTESWTEITVSPNYEDGARLLQRQANGKACVNQQEPSILNWVDETTNLCTLDVDLIAVVFGEQPILGDDDFIGVTFGTGLLDAHFSKEVWQPVAGANACDEEGNQQWIYWAFPNETNSRVQEFTFTNDVFTFGFQSQSREANPLWDIGNPWLGNSPVSTWDPGKHFAFTITTVPPPEPSCGAVEIGSLSRRGVVGERINWRRFPSTGIGGTRVLRLLITGCGRSGTLWAARALQAAGVECGHEEAFNAYVHGEKPWMVESSSLAVPFLPVEDVYVVHLVRNPMDVIASIVHRGGPKKHSSVFLAEHAPNIPAADSVGVEEHAARYWVSWNDRVVADEVAQVEDVTESDVRRWAQAAGFDPGPFRLPNVVNASQGTVRPVNRNSIQSWERLQDAAERWGYSCLSQRNSISSGLAGHSPISSRRTSMRGGACIQAGKCACGVNMTSHGLSYRTGTS